MIAMPIRNTIKLYDAPAYYHVYNRGIGGRQIFYDNYDRAKFMSLLARHLDPSDTTKRTDGVSYEKYDLELLAYCLMGNHFHMLLFQKDLAAITQLMRSVTTAYSMYFNRKYKQNGHLFQSVFKASHIDNDAYLLHITRYIHMNPRSYIRYKWSSIAIYLGKESSSWINPERINDFSPTQYREFLDMYKGKKDELRQLKERIAGY